MVYEINASSDAFFCAQTVPKRVLEVNSSFVRVVLPANASVGPFLGDPCLRLFDGDAEKIMEAHSSISPSAERAGKAEYTMSRER